MSLGLPPCVAVRGVSLEGTVGIVVLENHTETAVRDSIHGQLFLGDAFSLFEGLLGSDYFIFIVLPWVSDVLNLLLLLAREWNQEFVNEL